MKPDQTFSLQFAPLGPSALAGNLYGQVLEPGQPVWVHAIVHTADLPDQREGTPHLGPAAVKGKLGHDLHGLLSLLPAPDHAAV